MKSCSHEKKRNGHTDSDGPSSSNQPQISTLERARRYVRRGWSVIPLVPWDKGGKSPVIRWREFQKRRPTDEELRRWFATGKNNVGIVTGQISGLAVIDCDSPAAIERAESLGISDGPRVRTGRGEHFYFRHKVGAQNFQKRDDLAGIDFRGEGGYVVAPPSRHSNRIFYRWKGRRKPLPKLPDWILASRNAGVIGHRTPISGLLRGVVRGSRNDALARLAGRWISDGFTQERILRMAIKWNRRNRPPLEEEEVRKTVNSILRKDALRRDEHVSWPNPIPLRDDLLLPVPVFPPDLIPLPLRPWILDVADRMQCPIEIPFVAAMVSLATVVGNRIAIRPKALDDWTGVPNLWGAVVGEPGLVMKTPAIQEGMKPLSILAQELQDNYEQALEKRRPADSHGHEPKEEMLIVNDTTVEALGELLNENPHGLMLYRDELVGFIAYLDRSNHRGDRQFFLECWNGKGTYRIRRIKRGRLTVKNTILSILGGIQPDPLKRYLREAFARGKGNDGFIQRFQLMVFPEFKADWHMVDKKPDKEAQEIVVNLFRKLRALRPASIGAEIEEGTKNPLPFLHFSRQAQLFFNQWYEKHRRNIEKRIANGMTNGPLDQHFIKYDGLMSSLALHFHLLDVVAKRTSKTRVGLNAAKRAARFCALLAAHARKVYGLLEKEDITRVRTLQNHIRRGELPNPFTSRDVYRKNWSILNSKAEVVRALNALKRLHWLRSSREEGGERGGRPTYRYYINPKVLQ